MKSHRARAWVFASALMAAMSLAAAGDLRAHHPGSASSARIIDGRTLEPSNQLILDSQYRKGEQENRHRLIMNAAAEFSFLDDILGLTVGVPWHYLAQKNRKDAARFGRPRVGLRFRPLVGPLTRKAPLFLVLDGDLGFASGSDRGRFLDEDFWEYTAGVTVSYTMDRVIISLRGGGRFPLSRLPRAEATNPLDPPPWEPVPELARRETHDLKKVGEWELIGGFRLGDATSVYVSFAYRTPFAGIVKEKATGNSVPAIYREAGAGVSWSLGEKYNLRIGYRYPLFRKREQNLGEKAVSVLLLRKLPNDPREFRLFDESWNIAVVRSF